MAFAIENHTANSGLKLDLSAAIYALMNRVADHRAYRRTLAELSALSDHELADLGLSRYSVRTVAHKAVYGSAA